METRLTGRQWIMGDLYTIADISMLGWVRNLVGFYGARDLVEFDSFPNVAEWLERGLARPAVRARPQHPGARLRQWAEAKARGRAGTGALPRAGSANAHAARPTIRIAA